MLYVCNSCLPRANEMMPQFCKDPVRSQLSTFLNEIFYGVAKGRGKNLWKHNGVFESGWFIAPFPEGLRDVYGRRMKVYGDRILDRFLEEQVLKGGSITTSWTWLAYFVPTFKDTFFRSLLSKSSWRARMSFENHGKRCVEATIYIRLL